MCSLDKAYECYTDEQEAKCVAKIVMQYEHKKRIFGTPPDADKLEKDAVYIERQLKGVKVPWYVLVYEVLPKDEPKDGDEKDDDEQKECSHDETHSSDHEDEPSSEPEDSESSEPEFDHEDEPSSEPEDSESLESCDEPHDDEPSVEQKECSHVEPSSPEPSSPETSNYHNLLIEYDKLRDAMRDIVSCTKYFDACGGTNDVVSSNYYKACQIIADVRSLASKTLSSSPNVTALI